MKKLLFSCLSFVLCTVAFAQDLPTNPEPGKCYVRCVTPDVWTNQDVTVQVSPAYKKLRVVPATYSTQNEEVVVQSTGQELVAVPAVYETQTFEVVVQPASQKVSIVPEVYENVTETVVVKEASQRLEIIPAVWGTETLSYKKREFGSTMKVVPATFTLGYQTIEVKPASAKWEMSDTSAADCASSDPNDCRYWCYKNVPAQNITVNTTELSSDAQVITTPGCNQGGNSSSDCGMGTYTRKVVQTPATTRVIDVPAVTKTVKRTVMATPPTTRVVDIPAITKTMKRTVMATPPTTRVIDIPAVTKTMKRTVMSTPPTTRVIEIPQKTASLKRTVLASDTRAEETVVPAVSKTVRKEVLTKKGGLTTWKEVDCKLVEYNDLNINWNLGSATLTNAAKAEIDAKLLPVLKDGVSVEIASHTDSRGSKASNRALSERRAQAVTNYLISKGVNSSRIVSNGYGESRLTNRCSDGVSCTEREHLANRRTQFRVINQ